jgi:hypothetical protein
MPTRTRSQLVLALALVCAFLALPAAASAATGAISGTVTGAGGGGPVAGEQVCARPTTSSFAYPCGTTNSNGEFTIASVAAGTYRVHFEGKGEYIGQWFDGVAGELEAEPITVAEGATTEEIDATLTVGAVVEGTVTDAESGAALEHVQVCAATITANPINNGCTVTEAGGHYRLVGIPTGEYKLRFEPEYLHGDRDYLTHFYPDAANLAEGTSLQLTDGQTTTGIDSAMQLGGTVSGKVVDEAGEPVSGVTACVYPILGNTNGGYCITHQATTGADGTYTVQAVPAGEFKVRFYGNASNYLPQFYPDQPTRSSGAAIVVTAPDAVTGIDATMHAGGSISGVVVEDAHFSLTGGQVCAFRVGGNAHFCTQVKSNASYSINSLASGEYLVEFGGTNTSVDWPYIPTFFEETSDRADATPVHVTAGHETQGIGGIVHKGGTISGTITDAGSGDPAEGIYVCAYSGGEVVGHCDTTHASGEYTIVGLPAGEYAVRATPAGGGPEQDFLIGDRHYLPEYFEAAATEATATLVTSGPGTEATGKDIAMREGGGISGTITGPLGEPLPSVEACVVESAEELGEHCASSGAGGEYEIAGLYPGQYVVSFWGGPRQHELSNQYYDDAQNFAQAESVPVSGTAVTPGIDAQLHPGGTIAGTVTDAYDGTPIEDVWVCAMRIAGTIGNCAETDAEGNYSMPVSAGSYTVEFSLGYIDEIGGEEVVVPEFDTQFFDGVATEGEAGAVTVAPGAAATGIDASLTPAPGRVNSVSVSKTGNGAGAVVSSPAGIDCGATCDDEFETRKTITLEAEPATNSNFAGWTGACSGTGPCHVRLTAATSVVATFEAKGAASGKGGGGDGTPTTGTSTTTPSTGTSTTTPPATTAPAPTKPNTKLTKKSCPAGKKLKKVGKAERCVKKPKKKHPRKQHPKKH